MTFPADILSYVLGFFSRTTTAFESALSTAIGGAPFRVAVRVLPGPAGGVATDRRSHSALVFGLYVWWVVLTHPDAAQQHEP